GNKYCSSADVRRIQQRYSHSKRTICNWRPDKNIMGTACYTVCPPFDCLWMGCAEISRRKPSPAYCRKFNHCLLYHELLLATDASARSHRRRRRNADRYLAYCLGDDDACL